MIASAAGAGVPATLSADESASVHWSTIVIGGGPAGAAVAIHLARGGRRVLLLDRENMPRPKVCGCCLSSRALAELRGLGCATDDRGRLLGATPLERLRLVAVNRAVTLPLPEGGTLSRESLDSALVRTAIATGAAWLPWSHVTSVAEHPGGRPIVSVVCRAQAGEVFSLEADSAVIATGLADHVRVPGSAPRAIEPDSRIGVGTTLAPSAIDLPTGELMMVVGRGGYCGIVRLEDDRIDVAAAIDRKRIAATESIGASVAEVLREAAGPAAWATAIGRALADASLRATPPLTRSAEAVADGSGRILRVGDAAGYVEPFTGEGMGWALTGGRLAAEAVLTASSPAAAYRRSFDTFARRHHRRCRRIATALRHPRLVGAAMRVAAATPRLAAALVPLLVGTTTVPGDSSP